MDILNSYGFIILLSLILIFSYFFNILSKKTNIPAVLLLILTGIGLNQGMVYMGWDNLNIFPILEVLGIVGLIMIVLEAALELELKKEKWPIIWKSFAVALLGLVASAFAAAFIFRYLIDGMDQLTSLLYAIPLSILSSAIIIPSVGNLIQEKKEFHIYESTFSDILGIMFFYFVLGMMGESEHNAVTGFLGNLGLTIIIAMVASYILVFIFQNLKSQVKLFVLIAILLLLYSISKLMHLSSLIIILIFGLVISNSHLFFRGFLKKWLNNSALHDILEELHVVTVETAFVVRTFFFVIFGITITLSSLLSWKVAGISLVVLLSIYVIRFLLFKLFIGKNIVPQLYIAPRGLITVLLFFAIPLEHQVEGFDSGILLFIIIATSLIMTGSLIHNGRKKEVKDDLPEFVFNPDDSPNTDGPGSQLKKVD